MVCKELDELCQEFGKLSPHERIDIICGMLQMCLAPELRFIGSVVVDLSKKDYNYLREREIRANKQEKLDLIKQSQLDERTLRNVMALNIALLHSDNTQCANIIFDILENNMKQAFQITHSTEKESEDIILLVLTMAMKHPAFTFHQRSKMYEYYVCVKQQLQSLLCKLDSMAKVGSSETNTEVVNENRCMETNHIRNIDVIKTEKAHRHDRKRECKIQVTWNDNTKTEVLKTWTDFKEFHSKLVKQYPKEAEQHKHDRKLPFLTCASGGTNVHREDEQHIAHYTKQLLQMPKHILDCDLVFQFFRGERRSQTAKEVSLANLPVSKDADPVIPHPPVQTVNTHTVTEDSQQTVNSSPPLQSVGIASPSFVRMSPSQSPQLFNHTSPTDTCSNSPAEEEVSSLLSKLNVNQNSLEKMPPSKLFSSEDMASLGISLDEAAKLKTELSNREKLHLHNGMIDHHYVLVTSSSQQIPQVWNHQVVQPPYLTMAQQSIPPVMPGYIHPASLVSTRDSSPTGSDFSSPTISPHLKKKILTSKGSDSSSEENEKDKNNRTGSPYVRKPSKVQSVEATPQLESTCEVGGLTALTGGGYQSDPSPSPSGYCHQPPVINIPRPYKAQPAHTSRTIPPNNIISMPLDSIVLGKRPQYIPIGFAPPIPRSDVVTITSTTNTVTNTMENMGKRILYQTYPIRSQMNGGHRTYVCNVTNSTSVTMSNHNSISSPHSINGIKSHMSSSHSESSLTNLQSQESPHATGQPSQTPSSNASNMQYSSSSHTTCTSCGCTGAHSGNTNPYHPIVPSQLFHGQHLWPMATVPMTPTSNGLIPHFIPQPFPYPHIANFNGLAHPEILLNNHHSNFVHSAAPSPYSVPTSNVQGAIINPGVQRSNSIKDRKEKPRVLTCYNCGSADHIANECNENSMESILGHYHLNYEPKD